MTLTATPASATTARRRSAESAAPIAGGEAWVVPYEPGGHPWLTASAPQLKVIDRRTPKPT